MKNKDNDTYSYKGWLLSDKWYRRALAVYGYCFLGGLIIVVVFYILIFLLAIFYGFLQGFFGF